MVIFLALAMMPRRCSVLDGHKKTSRAIVRFGGLKGCHDKDFVVSIMYLRQDVIVIQSSYKSTILENWLPVFQNN